MSTVRGKIVCMWYKRDSHDQSDEPQYEQAHYYDSEQVRQEAIAEYDSMVHDFVTNMDLYPDATRIDEGLEEGVLFHAQLNETEFMEVHDERFDMYPTEPELLTPVSQFRARTHRFLEEYIEESEVQEGPGYWTAHTSDDLLAGFGDYIVYTQNP